MARRAVHIWLGTLGLHDGRQPTWHAPCLSGCLPLGCRAPCHPSARACCPQVAVRSVSLRDGLGFGGDGASLAAQSMQLKLEMLANEEKFQAADEMIVSTMIREWSLPAWQPWLLRDPACLPGSPGCCATLPAWQPCLFLAALPKKLLAGQLGCGLRLACPLRPPPTAFSWWRPANECHVAWVRPANSGGQKSTSKGVAVVCFDSRFG